MLKVKRKSLGHINGILHNINEVICSGNKTIGTFNSIQISNKHFYTENSACLSSAHITRGEFIDIISNFTE